MAGYLYSIVPEPPTPRERRCTGFFINFRHARRKPAFWLITHNSLTCARALMLWAAAHNLFDTLKHSWASTHPPWLQFAQNLTTSFRSHWPASGSTS
jgi:hypothetical protein